MISINTLNLREIRKKTGYTQKEMASFFGINLRTWQRWEQSNSKIHPSAKKLLEQFLLSEQIEIKDKCKLLRELLGLSKKEMSSLIGINNNTWGRWENGKQQPQTKHRKQIHELIMEYKVVFNK